MPLPMKKMSLLLNYKRKNNPPFEMIEIWNQNEMKQKNETDDERNIILF